MRECQKCSGNGIDCCDECIKPRMSDAEEIAAHWGNIYGQGPSVLRDEIQAAIDRAVEQSLLEFSHHLHILPRNAAQHEIGMMEVGYDDKGQLAYGPMWLSVAETDAIVREFLPDRAPRPEPRQTDDLLWQEIFSLREKVKIAVAAVKSSDPKFDDAEFTHRLNSVDYDQLMEELSGDKPEPRQTAGEGEAVNETLTYLNAELDKRDGENGKMLALIRSLVTVFATEPGIDLLWDDARALLARKGE